MWFGEPHPIPVRGSPTRLSTSGRQSYEAWSRRTAFLLTSRKILAWSVISGHKTLSYQVMTPCHIRSWQPVISGHDTLSYQVMTPCHIRSWHPVISGHDTLSYQVMIPCHIRSWHPVISGHDTLSYQVMTPCHIRSWQPLFAPLKMYLLTA